MKDTEQNTDNNLTLWPEGECGPWTFETGGYCGKATDSIGIVARGIGCVLTREDAVRLRDWLDHSIANWDPNPKTMRELLGIDSQMCYEGESSEVSESPKLRWYERIVKGKK